MLQRSQENVSAAVAAAAAAAAGAAVAAAVAAAECVLSALHALSLHGYSSLSVFSSF